MKKLAKLKRFKALQYRLKHGHPVCRKDKRKSKAEKKQEHWNSYLRK